MRQTRNQGLSTNLQSTLPTVSTIYDNTELAVTVNDTWTDITGLSVDILVPVGGAKIRCDLSIVVKMDSLNWEYNYFRFVLDGTVNSESWHEVNQANPSTNRRWLWHCHTVFENLEAGIHTVKVQNTLPSSLNVKIYERRLTAMACQ